MTNEQLVELVRSGERDRLYELWGQVRRFAVLQGRRWARIGRGGVTEDDMEQAAFLALLDALENWRPESGAFITWFSIRLKAAFTEATGQRTQRDRFDPLDNAYSLDEPFKDDPDAGTLADVIPDPTAEREVEDVAERDMVARRHEAIRQALDALPEDQRRAVVLRYWFGKKTDSRAHNKALRALRRPDVSQGLRQYLTPV